jgi:hypothetical protein
MNRCHGTTEAGTRCRLKRKYSDFCHHHNIEECTICLEPIFKTTIIDCGHSFCEECIFDWMYESTSCPLCRTEIEDDIIIWKYVRNAIARKKLIRMQEISVDLSVLTEDEQDMLFANGLFLNRYMYEIDWDDIKQVLSIESLSKLNFEETTILVKTSCDYHRNYLSQNNTLFWFY